MAGINYIGILIRGELTSLGRSIDLFYQVKGATLVYAVVFLAFILLAVIKILYDLQHKRKIIRKELNTLQALINDKKSKVAELDDQINKKRLELTADEATKVDDELSKMKSTNHRDESAKARHWDTIEESLRREIIP